MEKYNPNVQWDKIFYGRKLMEQILTTIETKDILSGVYLKRYFFRAMMAGFIVAVITLLTLKFRADMNGFNPGLVSIGAGFLFSFALVLILFTNSELLTSNFMYFTVGLYYRRITRLKVAKIFALCFFGNLAGAVVLYLIVRFSTIMTPDMQDVLMTMVKHKTVESTAVDIFIRAIFANFFINISVVIAMQLNETMPKMFVMMMGVMIFAYMGYEHVIANTALFAAASFYHAGQLDMIHLLKNILFSFLGNYIGGGLIIGLFYAYLNDHRHLKTDKEKHSY